MKILIILVCVIIGVELKPLIDENDYNVGCVKCHGVSSKKLNVHLVPHSHDDVGWLKTFEQYYYGAYSNIQVATVQYIITTVVDALLRNPDRRYIQVETAFFWKWWNDQSDKTREDFKYLVQSGQIEMVNGAWAMNDEACTNYQSTIDQFTWGLRIINETVGDCGTPRIGWQIDPFGHSREQASIFAQLGFDGFFFARLDHDDISARQISKNMDFIWQSSNNIANNTIFTSILPHHYGPPSGFCWDIYCGNDPIVDDPESSEYNLLEITERFINVVKDYAEYYKTNNVLIPMGSDFQFTNAEANFINIDRLIKAFENNTDINVIYSTPSCYLKAVNLANPVLKLKIDDFFPYSDNVNSFWGGYFTSRPNSKRFERTAHNILQVAKQIYAQSSIKTNNNYNSQLLNLREAMGILQHHDAITGTEKQHVANDYVKLLHKGVVTTEESLGEALSDLLQSDDNERKILKEMKSCLLANVSICSVSQSSSKMVVLVYNPLAWTISHYVRLPVGDNDIEINGPDGMQEYDLVPTLSDFSFMQIPDETPASYDLVFEAKNIPPLGFKIYNVEKLETKHDFSKKLIKPNKEDTDSITLGWDDTFTINTTTNLLQSIKVNNVNLKMEQNFFTYSGSSGAYLFKPRVESPKIMQDVYSTRIFKGNLVEEFHQKWNDDTANIYQSIKVYKNGGHIEFDWLLGNLKKGNEIVTRYTVKDDFKNENTFYTDSNGREMLKRVKNQRNDYSYDYTIEPVASNYYPVTSNILIRDEEQGIELSVLNDRSQGGTSLNPGEIELMLHRRLSVDDGRGVGEVLNEEEFGQGMYVRGCHWLTVGKDEDNEEIGIRAKGRVLQQKKLLQPWIGLASNNNEFNNIEFSPLLQDLPQSVNILTFEPWSEDSYILRFEHVLEMDDDKDLSARQIINLKNLFKNFEIFDVKETTLAANLLMEDYDKREKYSWQFEGDLMATVKSVGDISEEEIALTPMQIRTFIVKIK